MEVQKFYGQIAIEAGGADKHAVNKKQMEEALAAQVEAAVEAAVVAAVPTVQSDWEEGSTESIQFIKNKPIIADIGALKIGKMRTRANAFGTVMEMRDIKYANGVWVAVGSAGKLATSSDGLNWTVGTSGFEDGAYSINRVLRPTTGNNWVIVGTGGKISSASDPAGSWSAQTPGFGSSGIQAVGYGNSYWVIAGTEGKLASAPTNPVSWTLRTSGFGTDTIFDVAYGNGIWVAVGANGKISTKVGSPTDNFILNSTTVFGSSAIRRVLYADGVWVAAGENGKLATATDPTAEWTIRNAGLGSPSNVVISDLVYANGIWVTVAGGGNAAYAIDPTKDWIPLSGIVPSALTAVHIAYGNATWVAVGLSGNMAISYPAL